MEQEHIFYDVDSLIVRENSVSAGPGAYFRIDTVGPVRTVRRRSGGQSMVDLVSRSGEHLHTITFSRSDFTGAMTFAAAVNAAVAGYNNTAPVEPYVQDPAPRSALDWILMIAVGIVAAVAILWLVSVLFYY